MSDAVLAELPDVSVAEVRQCAREGQAYFWLPDAFHWYVQHLRNGQGQPVWAGPFVDNAARRLRGRGS